MKIVNWQTENALQQQQLLQRPVNDNVSLIAKKAQQIIDRIRREGDVALKAYTKEFDKVKLDKLLVEEEELTQSWEKADSRSIQAIKRAIKRITHYQQQLIPRDMTIDTQDGIICQRVIRPIQKVGLYVPGGTAPLISTLMMLAIPAKIANCPTRIVCTPADIEGNINPLLLVTAQLCGIETIVKLGGVQAVAAMAYGSETVTKVDKIFGPGNAWVTAAKCLVSQDAQGASIDMPAGPSEVMIIADEKADPQFIAADLLSQAEHGVDSQVILVTTSLALAEKVQAAISRQLAQLSRSHIAEHALTHSSIIIVDTLQQAFSISNRYGPEHLILQIDLPQQYVSDIFNAGAVFVGPWTPETMGDYINGSNHVLPTYGFAKTYSSLSVSDFMHSISIQSVTKAGLENFGPDAMVLAEIEGLTAHKNAVAVRLQPGGTNDND